MWSLIARAVGWISTGYLFNDAMTATGNVTGITSDSEPSIEDTNKTFITQLMIILGLFSLVFYFINKLKK